MLLRLLLFFVLLYVIFLLLRNIFGSRGGQKTQRFQTGGREPEEMVWDPQCKSYLPKGEAILRRGHYFCSEECARVYLSR